MKDVSIFQNVVEFEAPDNNMYKAEKRPGSGWKIYRLENGAWIYLGAAFNKSSTEPSPARIWNHILKYDL